MANRISPYHPSARRMSEDEMLLLEEMRQGAMALQAIMDRTVEHPPGQPQLAGRLRYMALARTALEEAMMWATKGITY